MYKIKKRYLHKLIKLSEPVVSEVQLRFTEEGLRIKEVDPAHVCMLEAMIDKEAFEEYEEEERKIGVPIYRMKKLLQLGDFDDVVTLKYFEKEDSNPGYFTVDRFPGSMKAEINDDEVHFITLDTIGMTDPKLPELSFDIHCTVSNSRLRKRISLAGGYSDHVKFIVDPVINKVNMVAKSDEEHLKSLITDDIEYEEEEKDAYNQYAQDYCWDIMKSIDGKLSMDWTLSWAGVDYPMKFGGSLEDDDLEFYFLLAPKIESK